MPISCADLGRLRFTRHELFILDFARRGEPIPAIPEVVDELVHEQFIDRTSTSGVFKLTERGELACTVNRRQIEALKLPAGE